MKRENRTENAGLVVIGGGPAGLAAAISAGEHGIEDILILERNRQPGGILRQCIHSGFGLHKFNEELTGPEYASRYVRRVRELGIKIQCNTTVTSLTADKTVTCVSPGGGLQKIKAGAVILAMGCRERSRGALNIPGTRPAGIYTAGAAQQFVNMKGYLPGEKVVVLGSGDIGLIMARRMCLEGAEVKAVLEIRPYSDGLKRNIVQCLDDFGIPLLLNHTVTEIHGEDRLCGVTVSAVDSEKNPVYGTEQYIECDTLLLSVGLIPENELSKTAGILLDPVTGGAVVDDRRETSVAGIFSCGNVLHVHDVVDFVSDEAETAGVSAAMYLTGRLTARNSVRVVPGNGVRYVVPQCITDFSSGAELFFRSSDVFRGASVRISSGGRVIKTKKKRIVTPGEMERISLSGEELSLVQGDIIVEAGVES